MSKATSRTGLGNKQAAVDYDLSKLLFGDNEFIEGDVTASGADVDLVQGMVMGRISGTDLIVPLLHTATNGSQYPVGVCFFGISEEQTVPDGSTSTIQLVNKGRVNLNKINFGTASTLDDVVDGRRLKDWLNDIGLTLIDSVEQSSFDN